MFGCDVWMWTSLRVSGSEYGNGPVKFVAVQFVDAPV